jgi:hypothetical protein
LKVAYKLGLSEAQVRAVTKEVSFYWIATWDDNRHHWDWPEDEAASQEAFLIVMDWLLFEATDNLDYEGHNHLELLNRGLDPLDVTKEMKDHGRGYRSQLAMNMMAFWEDPPRRCEGCKFCGEDYPGHALMAVIDQIQDMPRHGKGIRKFIEAARGQPT